jgi:hypothetical protein
VRWIVVSGTSRRETEARKSAGAFLDEVSEKQTDVLGFRDGYFPFQGADIKASFEAVKRDFDPASNRIRGLAPNAVAFRKKTGEKWVSASAPTSRSTSTLHLA